MGTAALTRLAHWLLHDPLLDDLNRLAPESPFAFRKSYFRMVTRKRGGDCPNRSAHCPHICRAQLPGFHAVVWGGCGFV